MGDYRNALELALADSENPNLVKMLDGFYMEAQAELRRSEEAVRISRLGRMMLDLHRCEHGRQEGDPCLSCQGPSKGNPLLKPGTVIGHTVHGEAIVVPPVEGHNDPKNWLSGR